MQTHITDTDECYRVRCNFTVYKVYCVFLDILKHGVEDVVKSFAIRTEHMIMIFCVSVEVIGTADRDFLNRSVIRKHIQISVNSAEAEIRHFHFKCQVKLLGCRVVMPLA